MTQTEPALPYGDWLKLASDRDYLLTEETYAKLIPNKPYYVLQVDYIEFRIRDQPSPSPHDTPGLRNVNKFGFHISTPEEYYIYYPSDLIQFRETLIPLKARPEEGSYQARWYPWYDPEVNPNNELSIAELWPECGRWLSSGNGDGWSRWMLWDDALNMPPFYFPYVNDEEDEEPCSFDPNRPPGMKRCETGCDAVNKNGSIYT